MITKLIAKEVTLTKDNTKLLKKVEAIVFVESTLYDGLQTIEVDITDVAKLTAFESADKNGKSDIITARVNELYPEWVKTYAREITEVYAGEEMLKKIIGNDVIYKPL